MLKSREFKHRGKLLVEIENLFNVLSKDSFAIKIELSNEKHPIFQAHFPSEPLLPGFCHIDILSQVLKDNIKKINFLKLKKKTFPNEIISYQITITGNTKKVKILNNQNQLVGNLSYEC